MDEPCSALDPISTLKVEELINELKKEFTIAIVTHNMQQAARVSDYTAFMYIGELIEFNDTDVLFTKPMKKQTEDYITGPLRLGSGPSRPGLCFEPSRSRQDTDRHADRFPDPYLVPVQHRAGKTCARACSPWVAWSRSRSSTPPHALTEGDTLLAEQVIATDLKVNAMEVAIDEECSRILARRHPTASDLRLVYAIIKTITDLERIGDEAEKIARMARSLAGSERAGNMVVEVGASLQAGPAAGPRRPRRLRPHRRRVGPGGGARRRRRRPRVRGRSPAQCITFMMEDPRTIRHVLEILWSARALERIGDHARNIAEYVIYFVKGKDVRHVSLEDMARQVYESR